ncbi:hypothetical protein [Chondromyces crocatus]|uniref:DUF304 domain-containing protein n=1 Tax=Chondromyces crocatus TaxID=52 RepID=A0A0K1EB31_CHOCO|nr:hypothetical protein [Chondromyces crocatus]AKT37902.1 uncharacterized protein CMC5_020450 [Chondromyces crocatus]
MGRHLPTGPYREALSLPRHGDRRIWSAVERDLDPGEQLLWAGKPRQGLRLSSADAYLLPFGLVCSAFALIWEAMLVLFHGPLWFHVVGVTSGLLAFHLVVGRYLVDALRRARTLYALTDRRALILESAGAQVTSIELGTPMPIALREELWARGTISFGVEEGEAGAPSWPGMRGLDPPSFVGIRDARVVFDMLWEVRRKRLDTPRSPRRLSR